MSRNVKVLNHSLNRCCLYLPRVRKVLPGLSLAWVLRGLLVGETAMTLKHDPWRLEYGVSLLYLCYGFDFLIKERKCSLAVSLPEAPGTRALWYKPQLPAAAPVILSLHYVLSGHQGHHQNGSIWRLHCLTLLGCAVVVLKRTRNRSLPNEHCFSTEKVINI